MAIVFSITNVLELGVQILVSLLIGVVFGIPIVSLYMLWRKASIKKHIDFEDLKNQQKIQKEVRENVINRRAKKEEEYPTISSDHLRRYSENRFFTTRAGTREDNTRGLASVERGDRALQSEAELGTASDTTVVRNKRKFDWD